MILISGASCAGKTTTATTLLRRLRVPAVFWPRESVRVAVADRSAPEFAELEHRLFASYVDALVGYARRGFVAIGETIIMNEVDWSAVRRTQLVTPCMVVRLVCSLPVLIQREHVRRTTHPGHRRGHVRAGVRRSGLRPDDRHRGRDARGRCCDGRSCSRPPRTRDIERLRSRQVPSRGRIAGAPDEKSSITVGSCRPITRITLAAGPHRRRASLIDVSLACRDNSRGRGLRPSPQGLPQQAPTGRRGDSLGPLYRWSSWRHRGGWGVSGGRGNQR